MDVAHKYAEAKEAFDAFDTRLNDYASMYAQVAAALKDKRGRMIFANTAGGLPMEASMSRDSVSINANDVPDPARIQNALADWHKAKANLEAAWNAIPEAFRESMTPPPILRGGRR